MRKRAILDTALIWLVVMAGILACAVAWGQTITVKPDGGRLLGYAGAPAAGRWVVFAAGFLEVKPEVIADGKAIVWQGPAGEYAVVFFGSDSSEPVVQKVVLGGGAPDPFPPVPPPPQPPPGKRWAAIWEETNDRTTPQGNLFILLRKQYQDGRLQINDVTNLPPSLQALESQRPPSLPLPVLMVVARQADGTDKVVRTVALPSSVDGVAKELAQ